MTLWITLALLSLVALAFVVRPLWKSSGRLTPILAAVIIITVGSSAALYYYIGEPNVPSGAGTAPAAEEMVVALAERLEENPEDVNGWLLLGRSYQSIEQYDDAIMAFETAIELEQGQNTQSLVALATALMAEQNGEMSERAESLFEDALLLEPSNANALFYGGGAAARSGNTALAADRWEMLLNQDAPPEIQELLQRKINEWRGQPPPSPAALPEPQADDSIVSINLSLSEGARAASPPDARVFVIARDPAQPSPPIAVTPLRVSELPTTVKLGDKNSMVAGRLLSAFSEIEIVARVSLSGGPAAKSGDWSGSLKTSPSGGQTIDLVIDQELP